ncbi:MAG: hypothetical protein O3B64_02940 [bacterium]|nr:hypothetical protein [bacterium]MDA1024579.1 hypothetical protein [bacterium]
MGHKHLTAAALLSCACSGADFAEPNAEQQAAIDALVRETNISSEMTRALIDAADFSRIGANKPEMRDAFEVALSELNNMHQNGRIYVYYPKSDFYDGTIGEHHERPFSSDTMGLNANAMEEWTINIAIHEAAHSNHGHSRELRKLYGDLPVEDIIDVAINEGDLAYTIEVPIIPSEQYFGHLEYQFEYDEVTARQFTASEYIDLIERSIRAIETGEAFVNYADADVKLKRYTDWYRKIGLTDDVLLSVYKERRQAFREREEAALEARREVHRELRAEYAAELESERRESAPPPEQRHKFR